MGDEITIRIWKGCQVKMLFTIGDNSSSTVGAVSGAECASQPDIELDPWAGLIVDRRVDFPAPVLIKERFNE